MSSQYNPPLRVLALVATRSGDVERGPAIRMRSEEARLRMLVHGELVWIRGPHDRNELATLIIDDAVPRGEVILRDVVGAAPSEIIQIIKPGLDRPPRGGRLA